MSKKSDKTKEINTLESLKLRIENTVWAEKAFIRYSAITVFVLVIVAVAKGGQNDNVTISVFGKLDIPSSLIVKQVFIIQMFFSILLLYSFVEWVLAIIDVNRHPLYEAYCKQKSFVGSIADIWDSMVKKKWLKLPVLLDLIQKALFITMICLIFFSLWTL